MKIEIPLAEKQAYSVEEFGSLVGLSKQTIYNELHAGRLHSFKVGKRRLISREAVADWKQRMMGAA